MERIDRARRLIEAPREQVFAACMDPELLVRWLPPAGMAGRIDVFEPHDGGMLRIVLTYDDPQFSGKSGEGQDVIAATFRAIRPPQIVSFESRFASDDPAMQGTMRMDWFFDDVPGGTMVRIEATHVPPGITAADHAEGMNASLAQLAALFAPKG